MKQLIKLFIALTLFSGQSHAGLILQDQLSSGYTISSYQPIGQSFVAEDSAVSFAFSLFISNSTYHDNDSPLKVSLLNGEGLEGEILGTSTHWLPDDFGPSSSDIDVNNYSHAFLDTDFTDISLTIGSKYTAIIETIGGSPYWGVWGTRTSSYAAGQIFESRDSIYRGPEGDLAFRVTPFTAEPSASVPAPASLSLMVLAFAFVARQRLK